MRILHIVESYYPAIGGMQEVVQQLSEKMVKLGHEVDVATSSHQFRDFESYRGVKIHGFDISGNAVHGYRWGDAGRYREFLLNSSYDVIVFFAAQQWSFDLSWPILDSIKAKKVFVPTGYSSLYDQCFSSYFSQLPSVIKKFDEVIYLSREYRDFNFAVENNLGEGVVIPNGADTHLVTQQKGIFRKRFGLEGYFIILVVGSHTGAKGHREAIQAFSRMKSEKTALVIIGNSLHGGCAAQCKRRAGIYRFVPDLFIHGGIKRNIIQLLSYIFSGKLMAAFKRKKKLLVLSLDRSLTENAFCDADLFFLPSNIECSPIVLFESMATGVPFAVSNVGNSAEIVRNTQAGFLVPTSIHAGYSNIHPDTTAVALDKAVNDKPALKVMGNNGKRLVSETYNWDAICLKYIDLYQNLVAKK